jgi:hypothetical protein
LYGKATVVWPLNVRVNVPEEPVMVSVCTALLPPMMLPVVLCSITTPKEFATARLPAPLVPM